MFENFLKFFIKNHRLNYFLFFAIVFMGIYSYKVIPKEIFPQIDMDKITISGNYVGSSIDSLNKMAVIDIEDSISSIEGIVEVITVIKPGQFKVQADIDTNYDKYEVLKDIKDALDTIKSNLPSDMDDPIAKVNSRTTPLMDISISSPNATQSELIAKANEIKSKFSKVNDISNVMIFGDSDEHILFELIETKIKYFDFTVNDVTDTLKSFSYLFPLGTIEQNGDKKFFISSWNGKKSVKELNNTLIKIKDKYIYLSDILKISKKYKDSLTLSTLNANNAIMIRLMKSDSGDSIQLSEKVTDMVNKLNSSSVNSFSFGIFTDTSKMIKERLDIVMSNIFFSLLLIVFCLFLLINKRISFVVALGVPTSFMIGLIFFINMGHTLNLISLLGVLIAIGVLVDDAIIVSENIQRHIEEGMDKVTAAIVGTKEVALPVVIASTTTLFAFFPMFMISGTMGNFIIMIPIAVILLILASVIESFLFLPIHAAHVLDKKEKDSNWSSLNNFYKKTLTKFIKFRKSSLFLFFIIVPVLIGLGIKNSKFQFFPKFDSNNLYISGKLNVDSRLEDTHKVLKEVETLILLDKEKFNIKYTTGKAGFRLNKRKDMEFDNNLMYVTIELDERVPQNFVDEYITPYLSFYYDKSLKKRKLSSKEIAKKLTKKLEKIKLKYPNIVELEVVQDKPGLLKSDININLKSNDTQKIIKTISELEAKLKEINGVIDISNNAAMGNEEIKLKINSYAETFGLTESYISKIVSDNFLGNKKSSYFDTGGIFDIIIENSQKDDLETLENLMISVPGTNQKVLLKEVVDFIYIQDFEDMSKEDGETIKTVFANVNPKTITAGEVLEIIKPFLDDLKKNGVQYELKGEAEKKEQLKNDMKKAFTIALLCILIALLFTFNSYRVSGIIISVIPLSFLGVLIGHFIVGMNLTMPSIIGALGLAGVVINDGIIMLSFLEKASNQEELLKRAALRLRPILLTSITTFIGLFTLMFFATGQALIMQPLAVSLGFGLLWGTLLNLLYLPVIYTFVKKYHKEPNKINLKRL